MTQANDARAARLAAAADAIRRSQASLAEQTDEFKTLVKRAHGAGMTIREIATATGFASSWIGTIVRKS